MNQLDYQGPVEGLRAEIDRIHKECERYVRMLGQVDRAVPFVFGGVFVIFLLAFFGVVRDPFPLVIGYFVVLAAVLFYRHSLGKKVFEKRKIDLARDFVTTVGKDMKSGSEIAMHMSLDGYLVRGTEIKSSKADYFGTARRASYFHRWFSAAGRLHDGNRFLLVIKQWAKRNEKRKRKHTRVNETVAERIRLVIKIDPLTYPRYSMLPYHLQPDVYVGGLHIAAVHLVGNRLTVLATTASWRRPKGTYGREERKDRIEGEDLVALFIHLYSHLARCR